MKSVKQYANRIKLHGHTDGQQFFDNIQYYIFIYK